LERKKISGNISEDRMSDLALYGGKPAITNDDASLFDWPVITREDEEAVLDVLRRRAMSGTDITKKFEKEMGSWLGMDYALGFCNGTSGILSALWACGVGAGDEVICPSMTYWASAVPVLTLGGTVNFADIDPLTLCIDPADIEHRIGPRTKAIVVVHYGGYPCSMDTIVAIAKKHGLKIIEDASHAQGSLYKGKLCGTLSDVSVMSLMTAKSFAIGEAGMLFTNNRLIYERAISYGFYERTGASSEFFSADNQLTYPELGKFAGIPVGGFKHRMHQMSSAVGRVQLTHFPERIQEIEKAMRYFWKGLEDISILTPHAAVEGGELTMGGWYYPLGLFDYTKVPPGTLNKVCLALQAEGCTDCSPCKNGPLHLHPVFNELDLFRVGKPTVVSFSDRDLRQPPGSLPHSENIQKYAFGVPWFKHMNTALIDQYIRAFRKVFTNIDKITE
jgi:perosamine synthetase